MKDHTLATLRYITGEGNKEEVQRLEDEYYHEYKPVKMYDKKNPEIEYVRGFERGMLIIGKELGREPEKMTVIKYMEALELIKEKNKKNA